MSTLEHRSGFHKPPETPQPKRRVKMTKDQDAKANEANNAQDGAAGGAVGGAAGGVPNDGVGNTGTTPRRGDGVPPPLPQLFQMTPELFQQTVNTAVAAALAAQQQSVPVIPQPAAAVPPPVVPAKEKKLADFWVSRPTMWFRLFDGAFPLTLGEDRRFNALLNHLPSDALPYVDHILRNPDTDPFTRAKANLIRHYEVSPRDLARRLRSLTSLGDRTPSDMLFYMRSLLPGAPDNALFEVIFLDLLPANARDAAVKFNTLEEMADAADQVLAEQPLPPADSSLSANAISCDRYVPLYPHHDARPLRPEPGTSTPSPLPEQVNVVRHPQSRRAYSRETELCYIHAKFGAEAYKCAAPGSCKMKDISRPRPPAAAGNSKAGR